MDRRTHRTTLVATCAAGLLALGGLTGCSSGASDSGGGDPARSGAAAPAAEDLATSEGAAGAAPGSDGSATGDATRDGAVVTDVVAEATKVVRRAELSVQVDDVEGAAAEVRRITAQVGGVVRSEYISSDPVEPPRPVEPDGAPATDAVGVADGTITVAVPADALDATLDRLAGIGTVLTRTVTTDDVTAQYADTDSRVESARASVERVRALMAQATKLADVVTLEAELSRRQADLEALESRLAALEDQIALSPVTVQLRTDPSPGSATDDTGFLAGLAAGWDAFTGSVTVLLTGLGALLPFAAATAVVAVPLVLWWRRRTPRAVSPPAGPPAAPPSA